MPGKFVKDFPFLIELLSPLCKKLRWMYSGTCMYWMYSTCCSFSLIRVWLFEIPWPVAHQAPLSMGILQARILDWVAMVSSRGSSQCRDWTQVSWIAGRFFISWATRAAPLRSTTRFLFCSLVTYISLHKWAFYGWTKTVLLLYLLSFRHFVFLLCSRPSHRTLHRIAENRHPCLSCHLSEKHVFFTIRSEWW